MVWRLSPVLIPTEALGGGHMAGANRNSEIKTFLTDVASSVAFNVLEVLSCDTCAGKDGGGVDRLGRCLGSRVAQEMAPAPKAQVGTSAPHPV